MSALFWMLAACGGVDPVGTWQGTLSIIATDGGTYTNELSVRDDGTADATIYLVVPQKDPETGEMVQLIGMSEFTATWERADDITFALRCDWNDCLYDPAMDCAFDDESRMSCDATPDLYEDDESNLVWERDE